MRWSGSSGLVISALWAEILRVASWGMWQRFNWINWWVKINWNNKFSTITHRSFHSFTSYIVTRGCGGGGRAVSPLWAEISRVASWGTWQRFNWKNWWVKNTVKNQFSIKTNRSFCSTATFVVTRGSDGGGGAICSLWAEISRVASWGMWQRFNWKKWWVKNTVKKSNLNKN